MKRYQNLSGNSGVVEYETGIDFIRLKFKDGTIYLYTDAIIGNANVEKMKSLAEAGQGLNTFINTEVKERYTQKEA